MPNKKFLKNFFGIVFFLVLSSFNITLFVNMAEAATNISASTTAHWAWNDVVGWMDFYNTDTITVSSQNLIGYASSSVGDISLDCHTTRSGDICSQSNYQVTNDGSGNLSNWGWNDTYGWISFDCNNNGGCGSSNYRVYIDANGNFHNYAWNDTVGWISFNCDNYGGCGSSNYKVLTSWTATSAIATLDSTTYDTGVSSGAQLNSVMWHGTLPAGTAVRFQFATSNSSSGPWSFMGTDGTSNTYYNTGQDVSLKLDYSLFNNARYFRYKIFLVSDAAQSLSPTVNEVLINWSP
ncbi:MAG: hypothetical protein HY432_03345 [Candidatus Liptonbacteria bacterium]|nr:hypothetical protein [Candidatus Liptonbacteria bacterium]